MSAFVRFGSLAPKTKNFIVAGSLTGFVFGVYFYTMRAVGGTDELQVAIDKFEEQNKNETKTATTVQINTDVLYIVQANHIYSEDDSIPTLLPAKSPMNNTNMNCSAG